MVVPPLWSFALGALAAWRIYKLVSVDDILDRPREWMCARISWLEEFLVCPYCAGFWVSAIGSLGYFAVSDVGLSWGSAFGFLVTTFALSGTVVFLEVLLDLVVAVKNED